MSEAISSDLIITPRNILKKRVDALRSHLNEKGADAALIMSPANMRYLSGFTGKEAQVLITKEKAYLLTDFRYITQATAESGPGEDADFSYEIIRIETGFISHLNSLIKAGAIKTVFTEFDFIPYGQFRELETKLTIDKFYDIEGFVSDLRAVKDDYELSQIKKAIAIADSAFLKILDFIKPGMSEKDVASELEYYMNKAGSSGTSFDTIVVSGAKAAMPHGTPGSKKIQTGDVVTIDFGAVYNGYCSDMTRTFFMGKPDDTLLKIYNIVNEARRRAIEAARGGMTGRELDGIARSYIADNGYGNCFGHGLGHGVGLEIHEEPRVSPRNPGWLAEGSVVTIEPGIYVEGLGGVRIEDMVLLVKSGCELLTGTERNLVVL